MRIVLCYPVEERQIARIAACAPGADVVDAGQERIGKERAIQSAAGDMDHRRFEVHERKIRVQLNGLRERAQPLLAPCRMRQPKLVAPIVRIDRNGAPGRRERVGGTPGADQ